MREQKTADVLVIGAGIIGAATAFRLAERGLCVALLEAQAAPAMGSTGRSAAGVRVQFTEAVNVRLSWESIQEYRAFPELYGEDAGYRPIGYLFLVPEAAWARHQAGVALQRRLGAPVEVLPPEEAQAIVEFVPEGIAGATYGPADGVVDPHRVTHTYLRLARARGARLYLETPLLEARHAQGVWRARTPHGWFEAPYIVNAAGAWAGEVARRAGLEVPVWPVRRVVFVTGPLSEPHAYPLTVDLASGVYFRSEGERLLFGRSNPAEPPGFREGVDWAWLEPTLEVALARFPWFAGLSLDRRACWWGYYEVTPDHNPILGRMPGVPGWVNAAGFSGHGVQQAAAVGRVIAEEVVDGRAHSIDVDPLRYERFHTGNTRLEAHIV
ncbi:NAD(P)/FAD-dependent oxidoreductase [Marinithermus hydrothermalis]|uniref:FAD dependent oxidoreductase n=1 Tax=Marinithermus hydrothermalis (strain DSM 14884 / JCM 11576 / T1) TaxID=869210 RepID=F2NK20_MARHT|nr:FAD-dependent oxidoreductase [Marinithermus hydrothermalis]AEB11991.1 FAD dependent oxidoreductase [Marinithermus hydrothermalis DSM 14884]